MPKVTAANKKIVEKVLEPTKITSKKPNTLQPLQLTRLTFYSETMRTPFGVLGSCEPPEYTGRPEKFLEMFQESVNYGLPRGEAVEV